MDPNSDSTLAHATQALVAARVAQRNHNSAETQRAVGIAAARVAHLHEEHQHSIQAALYYGLACGYLLAAHHLRDSTTGAKIGTSG